jgi:hypothetical protein
VILSSPLLDERSLGAVTDLRDRGFSPVVVDVLRHEPPTTARSQLSALAIRLWRLDRAALRTSLARLGVPMVAWDSDDGLDPALAPPAGHHEAAVRAATAVGAAEPVERYADLPLRTPRSGPPACWRPRTVADPRQVCMRRRGRP